MLRSWVVAWPGWRRPSNWPRMARRWNCSSRSVDWAVGWVAFAIPRRVNWSTTACMSRWDAVRASWTSFNERVWRIVLRGIDGWRSLGLTGRSVPFDSWRWLPAPLHLLPGFARLRYLTYRERLSVGRCLLRMGRLGPDDWRDKTAGQWLHEQGQTPRTIDRFWSVVLVSALGDTVDRVALSMARKVFCRRVHGVGRWIRGSAANGSLG